MVQDRFGHIPHLDVCKQESYDHVAANAMELVVNISNWFLSAEDMKPERWERTDSSRTKGTQLTIVSNELERLGQVLQQLFIKSSGDTNRIEGTISCHHPIELTIVTLLDEVGSIGSLWLDQFSEFTQRFPLLLGTNPRSIFDVDIAAIPNETY